MAAKIKWAVKIVKGWEDGWQPELCVPPQYFRLDCGGILTKEEAEWHARMLRKAIRRIEKGESNG